jgi:serine/threonine protein kinase/tetratricopeptide (TPR) repeat protein
MPALFISYRRSDSPDTVKLIHERLKRRLPRWEIFYDHESIPLGDQFPGRLRAKVASAAVVLVIIGPKWLEILHERKGAAIDHVRAEVRLALETTSVVPILVGHAAMPTDADLAGFAGLQPLLQRNGRPVRPDPDFDGDIEPIIAHLKQFDSDEAVGATLADKYTLTAEIAHGGMGVVYLAEQKQPVKRTVAVKLIKPGMDSRDVLARFDAERQALAVMDHPNIAKVHDAGMTASGRPFFVMEYVKGVPITQYCDEKKLTTQERLNLFIPVCNAVQHAHQKGIIHRDLKPSNVLVEVIDGQPVPKVIDFGLAKALGQKLTDKTLYTTLDIRIGTLEYSAPEQAAGRSFDVDTRSDIYSLGVLLYELLTGSPPFTHAELLKIGEEEMRRVIREDEPTKPSKKLSSSGELPAIAAKRHLEPNKLTRLVQGDLDWIVMKCLEKERDRRYKNANDVGEELQRFLADEPVHAGPPSAVYRLRKFVRRHKAGLLTTAAVLLAVLLAGGGVGWALWDRAAQETARRAELARRMAETDKGVTVALQEAATLADRAQTLTDRPHPWEDTLRAARNAVQLAETLLVREGETADPELRARVRAMWTRLEADEKDRRLVLQLEESLLNLTELNLKTTEVKTEEAYAKIQLSLADYGLPVGGLPISQAVARIKERPEAMQNYLQTALSYCWILAPKADAEKRRWWTAVVAAADDDPWRSQVRAAVAKKDVSALKLLGQEAAAGQQPTPFLVLVTLRSPAASRLELARRTQESHPSEFWANLCLAVCFTVESAPQWKEATRYFTAALALRPDNFMANYGLGLALLGQEDLAGAARAFRKTIELNPNYYETYAALATVLQKRKDLPGAIKLLHKAIELNPSDAKLHYSLGVFLEDGKDLPGSKKAYHKAIELDPKDAEAYLNLSSVLYKEQDLPGTIRASRKAIELKPDYALAYVNLGSALLGQKDLTGASKAFHKAIELDPQLAIAYNNLGAALRLQNDLAGAAKHIRKALELDPQYAPAHYNLALVYLHQGEIAQAVASMKQAEKWFPISDPRRAGITQQIKLLQRLAPLEGKLDSILSGKEQPASNAERAEYAALCQLKQLTLTSARFYEQAFAAEPKLADDLETDHRYNAACSAALAAAGQGKDADKLSDQERADLRKQALQWLRADLAAWGKQLDKDADKARPVVQRKMTHWKQDTDLADVRDSKALKNLPPEERGAWQKLWQDVDTLLAKSPEK